MQRTFAYTIAVAAGVAATTVLALPAFAAGTTSPSQGASWHGWGLGHMILARPAVFGTVSAINGSSLTVTSVGPMMRGPMMQRNIDQASTTPTTYTVDATSATIIKQGATSTIAAVVSGDHVLVQGTVSGQNVTATTILDQGTTTPVRGRETEGPVTRPGLVGRIGGFFRDLFHLF